MFKYKSITISQVIKLKNKIILIIKYQAIKKIMHYLKLIKIILLSIKNYKDLKNIFKEFLVEYNKLLFKSQTIHSKLMMNALSWMEGLILICSRFSVFCLVMLLLKRWNNNLTILNSKFKIDDFHAKFISFSFCFNLFFVSIF
jgi:hypothetical protein